MEIIKKVVKAVSLGRIADGSIGFMPTDEEKWYNVTGEKEQLEDLVKAVVSKGNTIEFEYNNGVVGSLKLIARSTEKPSFKDQLDKVNYKTLMAEAHKIGLISTKVELCPELSNFEKKTATFKATVVIRREDSQEQTFEDFGEACGLSKEEGGNIDQEQIRCAWIRMASTRALVRALRQATNNMEVAAEELPSGETD